MQPYLKYIFGDIFGFLAAWTWIVAVMPATLAILSIVFVESIYSAAGVTDQADRVEHKLLSVLVLVVVSVANSVSTKTSTRLNGFFVVTKFATIAAVVLAGLVVVVVQAAHPDWEDVGGRDWFTRPVCGFLRFLLGLLCLTGPMPPSLYLRSWSGHKQILRLFTYPIFREHDRQC